jgi:hypothetical protein
MLQGPFDAVRAQPLSHGQTPGSLAVRAETPAGLFDSDQHVIVKGVCVRKTATRDRIGLMRFPARWARPNLHTFCGRPRACGSVLELYPLRSLATAVGSTG